MDDRKLRASISRRDHQIVQAEFEALMDEFLEADGGGAPVDDEFIDDMEMIFTDDKIEEGEVDDDEGDEYDCALQEIFLKVRAFPKSRTAHSSRARRK